jgi:hypothetical protein
MCQWAAEAGGFVDGQKGKKRIVTGDQERDKSQRWI